MMTRRFLPLLLVAVLAGCSSGVKLSDVPVEDKSGVAVAPQQPTGPQTQTRVQPVQADLATDPRGGPANTARLVYFDYDSFEIKPEAQAIIDAHSRYLKANPQRRVALEGHTDERGGREYNLALGQKRAEAVRRAMVLLGVQESQLEAVSFGEEKPAVMGSDEASWAQNRRVEIAYR